jgi:hypothetical protein
LRRFSTEGDAAVESDISRSIIASSESNIVDAPESLDSKETWEFTDIRLLQGKREEIVQSVSQKLGFPLIRKSRALYWDASRDSRMACSISKRYTRSGSYRYWYAFHPQWDEFLREGKIGLFVLGCMDQRFAFSIPWNVLNPLLPYLNTTTTERSTYWHIHIGEDEKSRYYLLVSKKDEDLPLSDYVVDVAPKIVSTPREADLPAIILS